MSAASVLIETSKATIAFSTRLVEARHGFEDSQAAALEEIGEQIAVGARRLERSRSKVVYLFDQVQQDRNLLNRRAVIQAERNRAADPVLLTGFGDL